jgi:hypothetical protein
MDQELCDERLIGFEVSQFWIGSRSRGRVAAERYVDQRKVGHVRG